MVSKNWKGLFVCSPLFLSVVLISCGKDPGSPVSTNSPADPLSNLQRPIVMKDIPAGTFTMGSSDTNFYNAQPPHQVTLSAFRMQETEVTQEQYLAVMGTNPAWFDTGATAPLRPVEQVSWYDAVKFCNALSLLSGRSVVYDTSTWTADFAKNGYRLPTEAEWEYACRGGTTTTYWWGADTNGMGICTWSSYNSGFATHPVATKTANMYGLYDMTGNVWEWCNDWRGDYPAAAATNPLGAITGISRVARGGSWINEVFSLRSALCFGDRPYSRSGNFGFRCVCSRN
jgi:formylglycine-generating enzyme required for sulfatase activity